MKSLRPTVLFLLAALIANAAAQQAPTKAQAAAPDPGEIVKDTYKNLFFGFSYRIPVGFVDRTDEMRASSTNPSKATVLLSVFGRPPLAAGTTVNSAVIIAAESASAYPGLKSAAQYFGPVSEVAEAKGMKPVNEPYEFPVDGKPIFRRDYMKQMSGVAMHQSTLAWLFRGYVLSFTFVGNSEEEVQSLIEWLRITTPGKSSRNSH